jgi:DNA-binding IclR family transcriptional regulator
MSLTPFNDLPPKPEYVAKIKAAFQGHQSLRLAELIAKTGLTKTQVLCAVQPLIKEGLIERKKETGAFCPVGK